MDLKLRIVKVDMDGYNGREFHPSRTDESLVVTPVKMESYYWGPDDHGELISAKGVVHPKALPFVIGKEPEIGEAGVEVVWTCLTDDGRVLELMDHEVEVLSKEYRRYLADATGVTDPRM